jgi:hypothetical protein
MAMLSASVALSVKITRSGSRAPNRRATVRRASRIAASELWAKRCMPRPGLPAPERDRASIAWWTVSGFGKLVAALSR